MRNILVIITTSFVGFGGLTNVMLNYYKALNRDGLQIDFASTNVPDENDKAYRYIKDNNSNYYCLGNRKKDLFKYLNNLKKLLIENKYDVIHVNGNSATMIFELYTAKKAGVKIRLAHGHTTNSNHPFVHKILRSFMKRYYTTGIAVSDLTGKWLYKNEYVVLNNAIDINKYRFNNKVREEVRKEFSWDDNFIIGHVGKLYEPKNHDFLIDIFEKYHRSNKNSKLVLVGGGHLENQLREKCKSKNLQDDVIFLGMRDDTEKIIQAMDCFVFPSLYEGLGLALIEAQSAGLKCLASDAIPIETKVTDNIEYLSLNQDAQTWADKISGISASERANESNAILNQIRENGFDIYCEAEKLLNLYK